MVLTLKVLYVSPAFYPASGYGGWTYSGLGLCNSLKREGIEVLVLTTNADGANRTFSVHDNAPSLVESGIQVHYCRRWIGKTLAPSLAWLLPTCVKWADIVHLTGIYSFPTIPTLLTCKFFEKPLVWSPRGSLQRWQGCTRQNLKSLWEMVCRMVAPQRLLLHFTSEEEAQESTHRFNGVPMAVVPNGVEVPSLVTHEPGNGALRLLFLGRLHPIKGMENLAAACQLLAEDPNFSWTLTIAGWGEQLYVQSLIKLFQSLNLSHHVKFAGEVDGVFKRELFEKSDLMILPSHKENFGNVIVEGLSHGVPVIASKGTPWQILEKMGCGMWVSNDPVSLAMAIRHMHTLPLREMGQRGRDWMLSEYSWDLIAKRMIGLYGELLAN